MASRCFMSTLCHNKQRERCFKSDEIDKIVTISIGKVGMRTGPKLCLLAPNFIKFKSIFEHFMTYLHTLHTWFPSMGNYTDFLHCYRCFLIIVIFCLNCRRDLCCKMSVEFDAFMDSNKRYGLLLLLHCQIWILLPPVFCFPRHGTLTSSSHIVVLLLGSGFRLPVTLLTFNSSSPPTSTHPWKICIIWEFLTVY